MEIFRYSVEKRDTVESLILLSIPTVLAGLYYLTPISFQQMLVLDHTEPNLHAFWTNAFVHEHRPDDSHVTGTILGYVVLVYPTWVLYRIRGQEIRFWQAWTAILLIGPFVASLSSYIAFHEILELQIQNDRGFSGVVGAFTGFLIMSILGTIQAEQPEPVGMLSMGFYFSYLMLGFGAATARMPIIVIGIVALGATVVGTYTRFMAPVNELARWGTDNRLLGMVLVVAAFASALAFAASLPTDITISGGGLKNIVAHGAGILFGMVVEISLQFKSRMNV